MKSELCFALKMSQISEREFNVSGKKTNFCEPLLSFLDTYRHYRHKRAIFARTSTVHNPETRSVSLTNELVYSVRRPRTNLHELIIDRKKSGAFFSVRIRRLSLRNRNFCKSRSPPQKRVNQR